MVLTINGKDYKIKYTIRALFLFEQMTGKGFKLENLLDSYIFFYCILLANNPETVMEWDEFLDAVDTDPSIMEQLNKYLMDYQKKDTLFGGDEDVADEKKS